MKLRSSGEKLCLQNKVQLNEMIIIATLCARDQTKKTTRSYEAFEYIIKKCQVTICNDRPLLKGNYKKCIVEGAAVASSPFLSAAVDTDGMPAYVNSTLYPAAP